MKKPSLSNRPAQVADPRRAYLSMANRLTALNGLGVCPGATDGLAAMFAEAAKNSATPMMLFNGAETPVAVVMEAARNHDQAASTALNALRMENIDLYVRATLDFGFMFNTITLKKNEQPTIMSTYRNTVAARFMGEDGGVRGVKAVRAQKPVYVNMREIHTDTVGYQVRDINQGTDIASASGATVDISWDLAHRINIEQFNFLQGGVINGTNYGKGIYGPFSFTGRSLSNTLVLHPSIQVANLPTTNLITPTDLLALDGIDLATAKGKLFRFAVLQSTINYCESFRGIFPDGDLEPTGLVFVPSSETTGLLGQVSPTGQFYNKVGEMVLNSFTKVEYGGRVWTLVGTPVLPPGACYPVLNKPVANYYVKPEFDFEHVETDVLKNWEERTAVKVMALTQLEPWRIHGLKVVYSNAANAGKVTKNL